ncbi:hypothetical protein [Glycomyces sp. MUSA5-2]|uniref:hypothetical protein n=1 Tax=Glycomyces sp. MUSA5-2 TaxID=2053002 RepID=UPI003009FFBF
MADDYTERWFYDITPGWHLPYPDLPERPSCIARGIGPFTRLAKLILPPSRRPRPCCWYHRGSWTEASETAIEMVEAATTKGLEGEELVDELTRRADRIESRWLRQAVSSLVDGGEPINYGSIADWRDGDRTYVGGRHRVMAMMQQGVRRTVTMRLELLDPATGRILRD